MSNLLFIFVVWVVYIVCYFVCGVRVYFHGECIG